MMLVLLYTQDTKDRNGPQSSLAREYGIIGKFLAPYLYPILLSNQKAGSLIDC